MSVVILTAVCFSKQETVKFSITDQVRARNTFKIDFRVFIKHHTVLEALR